MSNIKELIASKLRPLASKIREKTGYIGTLTLDKMNLELDNLPDTTELKNQIIGLIEKNLTEIVVPNGTTKIGQYAFYSNEQVRKITLPEGITEIGSNAFANTLKLETLNIPESVTTLKDYAFAVCFSSSNDITSDKKILKIPKGITSIPNSCFQKARTQTYYFPNSLTTISANAFYGHASCYNIYWGGTPSELNNVNIPGGNGCIFYPLDRFKGKIYMLVDGEYEQVSNLYLNDETINSYAFNNLPQGINIVLGSGVKTISSYAFQSSYITEIVFPNSVTYIGSSAIQNCPNLKNIVIGENIAEIGSNCTSMLALDCILTIKATTPPVLGNYAFGKVTKIYVPLGTRNAYITATNWSTYADKIVEPNTVTISIPNELLNNESYTYSVDGGELQQFTTGSLILENIATFKIKNTGNITINVGTTEGGTEIGSVGENAELIYGTTGNQTIYLTVA